MSYYTKKKDKKNFAISFKSVLLPILLVLVVFVIIGSIYYFASLSSRVNAEFLRDEFFAEYNSINESYKRMQKRGFNILTAEKNRAFGKKFAGFFKLESICEDYSDACLWNNLTYRTLDGQIIPAYYGAPNIGQFRTSSGALYMLYSYDNDLWIFVDTNGINKKPNRFGLDLFAFYVGANSNTIRIMGSAETPYQNINLYCNPYASNKYNGLSCPYKALLDNEYFSDTVKILY